MITEQHRAEAMSRAFAIALAGHAGAIFSTNYEFDYGIDGTFEGIRNYRGRRVQSGFPIQFQLKATTNWSINEDKISYALEAKNWNDMAIRPPEAIPLFF